MKTQTNTRLRGLNTRGVESMNTLFFTTVLFLLFSFSGSSQDLDDFEYASSKEGIKCIPYSSMQSKAGTLQGEKDRAFRTCSGYKGRQLHDSKKNSLRIQKEMKEDLEEAKEKLEDDDGSSSSVTNSLKSKVKELEDELKDITEEIEELDEKIDEGLEAWKALLEKRLEIDSHFQEVKKKLAQSKSYPDKHIKKPSSSDEEAMKKYEEDVKKLKEYIDDIEDTIDRGTYKHKTPISEAEKAIEWLENAKKLR